MASLLRRVRSHKGAALIEVALTLPLLLLVSVGIFEFGRAYQTWQVLTNAAREGARVAVISGTTDAQITAAVRNYMSGGALPNAATANIAVNRNVPFGGPNTASTCAPRSASVRHRLAVSAVTCRQARPLASNVTRS